MGPLVGILKELQLEGALSLERNWLTLPQEVQYLQSPQLHTQMHHSPIHYGSSCLWQVWMLVSQTLTPADWCLYCGKNINMNWRVVSWTDILILRERKPSAVFHSTLLGSFFSNKHVYLITEYLPFDLFWVNPIENGMKITLPEKDMNLKLQKRATASCTLIFWFFGVCLHDLFHLFKVKGIFMAEVLHNTSQIFTHFMLSFCYVWEHVHDAAVWIGTVLNIHIGTPYFWADVDYRN